jgi:hypothetical protein
MQTSQGKAAKRTPKQGEERQLTWQCAVTTGEQAACALTAANANAGTVAVAELAKCQCATKWGIGCAYLATQEDLLCDICRTSETCADMRKRLAEMTKENNA